MAKFDVGDRVRVVWVNDNAGGWYRQSIGKIGVVEEKSDAPLVRFDGGYVDCGYETHLEAVEHHKKDESAPKTETQPMTVNINIGAELTHITIGGKRFRLVSED